MALLDQWLSDATTRLHDQLAVITHKEALRIEQRSATIGTSVATLIARQQTRLQNAEEQLLAAPAKLLRTQQQRIDTATELLLSYSIEHVLQRGFAIARCGNQVVHSIEEVQQGETLEIELNDGRIDAQITKVTKR
jgi:exodeoxyribonuclease VII large subunit